MTFEERIDKLTERHEALAQSVEMLHADTVEFRAEFRAEMRQLAGMVDKLATTVNTFAESSLRLVATVDRVVDRTARIEGRVNEHNERLDELEGR